LFPFEQTDKARGVLIETLGNVRRINNHGGPAAEHCFEVPPGESQQLVLILLRKDYRLKGDRLSRRFIVPTLQRTAQGEQEDGREKYSDKQLLIHRDPPFGKRYAVSLLRAIRGRLEVGLEHGKDCDSVK